MAIELEELRIEYQKAEAERVQQIADIEAQISLSIQAIEIPNDSEDGLHSLDSQPPSRPDSRVSSNAGRSNLAPRSISTESTLAETAETDEETRHSLESEIPELEERDAVSESVHGQALREEKANDAMTAVDEGIHHNSDQITRDVIRIQQKV